MNSFNELENWLQVIQECSPNSYVILIGNKADLEEKREVSPQQAKDFAEKHHLEYFETSALSGQNVLEPFTRLACELTNHGNNGQI